MGYYTAAQQAALYYARKRRRQTAFSPSDLFAGGVSGFWHDFRRTDLLKQNSDGTTDVAADGNAVGWARSLDPTQRISTQATTAARPQWKTGGLLRFDGSDDNLLTAQAPGTATSLAVKFRSTTGTVAQVAMGSRSTSDTRSFIGADTTANGSLLMGGVGGQGQETIKGGASINGVLVVGILTYDGSTVKLYRDGAQVYSGAQSGLATTTAPPRIGALNNIGTAAAFLVGDIHQALMINRVLTLAEITQLSNYWNAL